MRSIVTVIALATAASADTLAGQVNDAIEAGVAWLKAAQRWDGGFHTGYSRTFPGGPTALAVYALAKSGVERDDPSIVAALARLRAEPPCHVYSVATLILALDALHDPTHDDWIRDLARWLEKHRSDRMWNYGPKSPYEGNGVDLSNTQFAALGLWTAERHGYRARRDLWRDLVRSVPEYQEDNGSFRYRPGYRGSGGMTTAGITVLALGLERIASSERSRGWGRDAETALERGWDFLARQFAVDTIPVPPGVEKPDDQHHYYYLYGLERIGGLANRPKIGEHDWYQEGARFLVATQEAGGNWGDGATHTCWALLFLRRATFTATHDGPPPDLPAEAQPVDMTVKPAGDQALHVRRWLVLGPFPDPELKSLDTALVDEANVAPGSGVAQGSLIWQEVSRQSWFTWRADRQLAYAFTYLHVSRPTRVVFWLEYTEGVRVFLDGKVVHRADADPKKPSHVESDLDAGVHRLLVKLQDRGEGVRLRVQVATRRGGFAAGVIPSAEDDARTDANLRLYPEFFSLQQMLDRLPTDDKLALDFDVHADVERVVWSRIEGGEPQWHEEGGEFWWGWRPPPGKRGLALVASAGEGARGLVLRKVRVPEKVSFRVTAAPEVAITKGQGDCRLRLGVFDGRMTWLADGAVEGARWTTLTGDLAPFAGRTVLLVVECGTEGDRWYEFAFLDEASVVPAD